MMSRNIRFKSALLVCAMVVSLHSFNTLAALAVSNSVIQVTRACISKNKGLSVLVTLLVAAKIRLMTKARDNYSYDDFEKDVKEIFSSFNIFKPEVRARIMKFVDKYLVGLEVKIEDTSTRTDNEDGSVFTIKGKKLTQKPFGVMGIFDAYVLSQMKKIVDYIPTIVIFYGLINSPFQTFEKAAEKAMK